MNHTILIASYRRDFQWLKYCLQSLAKFSTGFGKPVVAIPSEDVERYSEQVDPSGNLSAMTVYDGPGFGRAQAAMMSGDLLCPGADYVWLLGSDCLATRSFSPADYCDNDGKPILIYNTWDHMAKHCPETLFWRYGVEKSVGGSSQGEYMRRLPLPYPTELFKKTRYAVIRHCFPKLLEVGGVSSHDLDILVEDQFKLYVFDRVNNRRDFSESNVLGEVANREMRGAYNWVCIDGLDTAHPVGLPPNVRPWPIAMPITQFWSHGGFDRPRDQDGRKPRSVIAEVLGMAEKDV